MDIRILFIIGTIALILGYKFYTHFLEKLLEIKKNNPVPSKYKYDGQDFVPAKHWMILFGHHFSSIAGAGPIVGPILASLWWGWGPALVWAILGSIFIGGIHDFLSLVISVREGGQSIGKVSQKYISPTAGKIFLVFVWLSLLLVVAVFALVCTKTFIEEPRIVLPSLGIIPVAIIVGLLIYRFNFSLISSTIVGLSILAMLIVWGQQYPILLNKTTWLIILFIYAFIASITPVNILLQPRDYLSSFLLFTGLISMGLGILLKGGVSTYPFIKSFSSSQGGWLFPMMLITMACGAVSGFHSLVASGTTSKQLSNEEDAKKIGYAGMLTEGLLAILVILVLLKGLSGLNLNLKNVNSSQTIKIFSYGFGIVTSFIWGSYGKFLAIVILNSFILTTLDTATRITRYTTHELFKIKNKYVSTAIVVSAALILIFSGTWEIIWQVFGASNQLLATFTLFVASCWLINKKKKYAFAFAPAIFMLIVSITALLIKSFHFLLNKNILLCTISIILSVLGLVMLREVFVRRNYERKNK